jgi:hypothetical protein
MKVPIILHEVFKDVVTETLVNWGSVSTAKKLDADLVPACSEVHFRGDRRPIKVVETLGEIDALVMEKLRQTKPVEYVPPFVGMVVSGRVI